jgi:nucleoside-diphosphate-sugar epimerase
LHVKAIQAAEAARGVAEAVAQGRYEDASGEAAALFRRIHQVLPNLSGSIRRALIDVSDSAVAAAATAVATGDDGQGWRNLHYAVNHLKERVSILEAAVTGPVEDWA